MDGFERRRELKKKDILEAALELFMKYGVQKVSIAEIAKEANVSQVTIYNYFDSKNNLIHLVFKFYVDQIWDEMKVLLASNLPYEDKIKQMISFEKNMANHSMNNKFFQDLLKDYATGQSYVEEVYLKEGLPLLIEFVNDGKNQGFIDPSLSNEAILFYLQMFQEYMQRNDVVHTLLPLSEDLTKLFFYGIVGKKEKQS
ncbi:TetR/AcrR family transcriptional regulator [Oceanobacillus profundus]|uniref:TetR/AcrR family transcriptional regulator n=1 Tax=Oceanobacillus profundus TaxID=372463 RepID=UPI000BA5A67C|nr:TetR/AcrR family transcriptional regulator [Oceanobacillus profundus]MCM3400100.1 TetR/AcrR family transcriptional regulator [Oceanobacillus profundus]PAE28307.1 TetR family transcriptional regulator [Paenibacillus sp. 7884-2]